MNTNTFNRRDLLKCLAAGGAVVAGELWTPGKRLISIPAAHPSGLTEPWQIEALERYRSSLSKIEFWSETFVSDENCEINYSGRILKTSEPFASICIPRARFVGAAYHS